MTLSAAVVICAYTERRWADIERAVASVQAGELIPDELVLVIDHNTDLLRRARVRWPSIEIVPNAHRKGLSGARNTGIEVTKSDLIAFLDDDAAGRPGWLSCLTEPFSDSTVGVVGGRSHPVWSRDRPPRMLAPELFWIVGCSYRGEPTELAEVRNVMGCSMAFRRTALAATDDFNTRIGRIGTLPLGCEETELCIRITQSGQGWRILRNPASEVDHRVSADRESWRYLIRRSYSEGLSKASISRLVGAGAALATERSYVRRTLPAGIVRAVRHGQPLAAVGIIASVCSAGVGYLVGWARTRSTVKSKPALTILATPADRPSAA